MGAHQKAAESQNSFETADGEAKEEPPIRRSELLAPIPLARCVDHASSRCFIRQNGGIASVDHRTLFDGSICERS